MSDPTDMLIQEREEAMLKALQLEYDVLLQGSVPEDEAVSLKASQHDPDTLEQATGEKRVEPPEKKRKIKGKQSRATIIDVIPCITSRDAYRRDPSIGVIPSLHVKMDSFIFQEVK